MITRIKLFLFVFLISQLVFNACSDRVEIPIKEKPVIIVETWLGDSSEDDIERRNV